MLDPDATVTDLFLALVAVPSPSGSERALAEQIRQYLDAHGVGSELDGAGAVNGSDAGNLIATVPGAQDAPTYLFVAHMDTVETGTPAVTPRAGEDGVIRSDGRTILGADNKAAVAAVMRLCAVTAGRPAAQRPTVIAAFTCREENGRMGASLLDPALLGRVDCAFCVDGSRPIGTVITRALGQSTYSFTISGRAAHAAANPEAGINAIRVASEIVAALPLGRLPGGGSASVAAIAGGSVIARLDADRTVSVAEAMGGSPTNSVPDRAVVRGEVRGYSAEEIEGAVDEIWSIVRRVCDVHGAGHEWVRNPERMVPPFPAPGPRALELVTRAVAAVPGISLVQEERQATLEANYLAAHTDVVAVASGARDPHQITESIEAVELQRLESLLEAVVSTDLASTPAVA